MVCVYQVDKSHHKFFINKSSKFEEMTIGRSNYSIPLIFTVKTEITSFFNTIFCVLNILIFLFNLTQRFI